MLDKTRFVSEEEAEKQVRELIKETIEPLVEQYTQQIEDVTYEKIPKDTVVNEDIIFSLFINEVLEELIDAKK